MSAKLDRREWERLDAIIRGWWDTDLTRATEEIVRADEGKAVFLGRLMFLPFPYLSITVGTGSVYQGQFPLDTAFMNYALLVHERTDIVRHHLLNYLFMVERFGFAPNANYEGLLTRSQTPLYAGNVWSYYLATKDLDFLYRAYPLLKHEYQGYWSAPHHQTPIGLATNRDLGDPILSPEIASQAETGMDWMPIYGADIRRCVPIGTNCALVSYARVLARIGAILGRREEAEAFEKDALTRTELIHQYCWNEPSGVFLEYDFVAGEPLPYLSELAYWTLWSGVATRKQAARLVGNLALLEKPYGLACTDKAYSDPNPESAWELKNGGVYKRVQDLPPMKESPPEFVGGRNPLMWMYPAGWATTQLLIVAGLDRYGYHEEARRIATKFLGLVIEQFQKTGELWEKYNVVDGSLVLPNARYGNIPYHSFTSAAVVLLGRRVFDEKRFEIN
jgi:alpha,alpha-trehalase